MKKQFMHLATLMSFVACICFQQASAQNWTQAGDAITAGSRLGSTNGFPLKLITNNAERIRIDTSGRVSVNYTGSIATLGLIKKGSSLPGTIWSTTGTPIFTAYGETVGGNADFLVGMAGNAFNVRPTFTGKRAHGTLNAPSIVASGDQLVSFVASGYDGSVFQVPATIDFFVEGVPSANNVPTRISFVTGTNSGNRTEKLKISSFGDITATSGNLNMGSDLKTIQFALPTAANVPMMTMFPSGVQNYDRMVIAHSPAYNNWGLQYSDSLDKFHFLAGGTPVETIDLGTQKVGIGNPAPAAKLHVVNTAATAGIQIDNNYTASAVDLIGVSSTSRIADGYGYGVYATGGYMGSYNYANAGAYTGGAFGVYAIASGTAGTRYGVYSSASGGTASNYAVYGSASGTDSWGGYFPTKTYTNELRVGGTAGATGYVAAINGKLIATEVRVQPTANWPDYVFGNNYNLMSLDELEKRINADKHLPGVPAACEVKENGLMLGDMQTRTMEKLEENTLYILQLNTKVKEIDQLNSRIKELEKKIEELAKLIK